MPSKILNGKKKAIAIAHASSDDEDEEDAAGEGADGVAAVKVKENYFTTFSLLHSKF